MVMINMFFEGPNNYYPDDSINVICPVDNVASNIRKIIDGNVSLLKDTFTWGYTKEGYNYWYAVHDRRIKLDDEVKENLTRLS